MLSHIDSMLLFSESNDSPLNECMALLPFQTSQALKRRLFLYCARNEVVILTLKESLLPFFFSNHSLPSWVVREERSVAKVLNVWIVPLNIFKRRA